MKDILNSEFRDLRNRIMLIALFALTVIAILSLTKGSPGNKQAPSHAPAGFASDFGAELMKMDAVLAREFGLAAEGVIVNRVYRNTLADRAGLKREDIIIALNASAITNVAMFKSLFSILDTNDTARLTVLRGNQEITLAIGPGSYPMPRQASQTSSTNYLTASAVFIAVFSLLFFNKVDRIVIITIGAALMIIVGNFVGFYSQAAAFESIRLNVLALLLGLNLVTIILEKAGFFEYLANRILIFSNNDAQLTTILFCIGTYVFSFFVNNLTTILILLPVSLAMIKNMPIDPKKFLLCEIIASNLGGASTMIGDFPNMLISSDRGILFHDFLFNMAPITAILLVIMLYYFKNDMASGITSKIDTEKLIEKTKLTLNASIKNHAAVFRGLAVLAMLIVGFTLSNAINISPSVLAILGGFFLLLFESNPSDIIKDVCFKDIIFFCSLFVLVGGLQAAGILENIAYWMSVAAGRDYALLKLVYIIVISAIGASFLNAGPSTVLFVPVVANMIFVEHTNIIWWALSIGICIGSCSTLTGATAGPVAISIYEKFMKKDGSLQEKEKTITFMEYSRMSLPLMCIFVLVSIMYIGILNYIS